MFKVVFHSQGKVKTTFFETLESAMEVAGTNRWVSGPNGPVEMTYVYREDGYCLFGDAFFEHEMCEQRELAHAYLTAIVDAHQALDTWDPDAADESEIADVFEAIFGRLPDASDDPVSDIYAAKSALDASEAARLNKVLR